MTARASHEGSGGGLPVHAHGLDAVRLGAALLVGYFHLTWTYPALDDGLPVGWVGVQVFFVLSGIVIANSAERGDPVRFVRGRFLRLYPTAWICVLLSIAAMAGTMHAQRLVGAGGELGWQPILASFALVGQRFVTSSYWSLPVEIAFYALVAATIACGWVRHLGRLAALLVVWSACFVAVHVAVATGLLDGAVLQGELFDLGYGLKNVLLIRQGHYFGLGILLFLSLRHGFRRHAPMIALAVLTGLGEIHWRAVEMAERSSGEDSVASVFAASAAIWLGAIGLMWLSIRPGAWRPEGRFAGAIRALGLATYPFYLLHEAVGGCIMGMLVQQGSPPGGALAAGLAGTLAASLVVALALEPALHRALDALLPGRRSIGTASPSHAQPTAPRGDSALGIGRARL